MSKNSKDERTIQKTAAKKQPPKKKKKRRLRPFRVAILVLILLVLVGGIVAGVLLLLRPGVKAQPGEENTQAVFGVKTIDVEGSVHYTAEEIVEASGLYIGQSIFSLKKRQAAEKILQAFPYVEQVTVDSPTLTTLKITIEEAEPVAVVAKDDGWIILGANGKGLEALPEGSERLSEYVRVRCGLLDDAAVGSRLLSDESMDALQALFTAFSAHSLTDIREIDLRDDTDIRLNWRDQIVLALGNDINLDHKIEVLAAKVISLVLEKHGDTARGVINVSSYSGSDPDQYQAVFTPENLLPTTTAPGTGTSAAPTTTTASSAA